MYSMHRKGVAVLERDIISIATFFVACIGRELLYILEREDKKESL